VVTAWAIEVSAAPLRWVIAEDLAAGRAASAGAVLVPAAVAAHPVWEVSAAAEVAAVCAAAAGVAAAEAGGGKHHEPRKSYRELNEFEFALAKTSRSRRDSGSVANLGDRRIACRRANGSHWQG